MSLLILTFSMRLLQKALFLFALMWSVPAFSQTAKNQLVFGGNLKGTAAGFGRGSDLAANASLFGMYMVIPRWGVGLKGDLAGDNSFPFQSFTAGGGVFSRFYVFRPANKTNLFLTAGYTHNWYWFEFRDAPAINIQDSFDYGRWEAGLGLSRWLTPSVSIDALFLYKPEKEARLNFQREVGLYGGVSIWLNQSVWLKKEN